MQLRRPLLPLSLLLPLLAGSALGQQAFVNDAGSIPQGAPYNNSWTENLDFADVDLDGDWDVAFADGGDCCNDQNRLWMNLGGAQGGVLGLFGDETHTRFPGVLDQSRDLDFADLDADGDPDLFVTNSSALANQTSRWWINAGGAQGGSAGFFADETASRWLAIGVNDGVAHFSSVAPSVALPTGGFVDWSCDGSLADLDADGDLDLVHSSYGNLTSGMVPTRLFLNDGQGRFEEFNPSGFQLSGVQIASGSPGLWCEGTHQQLNTNTTGAGCDIANFTMAVDLGDLDLDFDLDLVHGEKHDVPRVFRNRLQETGGALAFRDVAYAVFPPNWAPAIGAYEQELSDLDQDQDLDLVGVNWADPLCESVFLNDGAGTFGAPLAVPASCPRDEEADYLDYDADGDLDFIVASDVGQDRLYRNLGGGQFADATSLMPGDGTVSMGIDPCDVDADGDFDAFLANDQGQANAFLRNVTQAADSFAPRIPPLEQAPDRAAGPAPTAVRAHVLDNEALAIVAFHDVQLEYRVNGGALSSNAMRRCGGQVFRGEIPGPLVGMIEYRVSAADGMGNAALSPFKSYSSSGCTGAPAVYCTAQVSSAGCTPAISWSGTPSVSAGSGFVIGAGSILSGKAGNLFYSKTGPNNAPFQGGILCVKPPTQRTPTQNSGGSATCGGSYAFDFNAWVASGFDPALVAGQGVWAQYWSRDPQAASTTNLTDAVAFVLCL